jgi:hypothetical protein
VRGWKEGMKWEKQFTSMHCCGGLHRPLRCSSEPKGYSKSNIMICSYTRWYFGGPGASFSPTCLRAWSIVQPCSFATHSLHVLPSRRVSLFACSHTSVQLAIPNATKSHNTVQRSSRVLAICHYSLLSRLCRPLRYSPAERILTCISLHVPTQDRTLVGQGLLFQQHPRVQVMFPVSRYKQ